MFGELKEDYQRVKSGEGIIRVVGHKPEVQKPEAKQRVIALADIEGYLADGWEWVAPINGDKCIIKRF